MNICRSHGFIDATYAGTARDEFERIRAADQVRDKPAMALALITAIDHCLKANLENEASARPVRYSPMAFMPVWALDGGRTGSRKAFGARRLEPYEGYITYTPSRRDDDEPMIDYAKGLVGRGKECLLITNDNFHDHQRSGRITKAWFDAHVISYQWIGRTNQLMLNLPLSHDVEYPPFTTR